MAAVAASCSHLWGSWSCRAAGETPARKSTNKYRDSGPAISSARQEYRLSDSDYNRSDHDHRHPVWRRGAQRILLVGWVTMSKAVVSAPPAAWAWVAAPWSARHGIILGVPIPLTAG